MSSESVCSPCVGLQQSSVDEGAAAPLPVAASLSVDFVGLHVVGGANTGCTSLSAPRPWPSSSMQVRPTAAAFLLLSEGMEKVDESSRIKAALLRTLYNFLRYIAFHALNNLPTCHCAEHVAHARLVGQVHGQGCQFWLRGVDDGEQKPGGSKKPSFVEV
eukprot:CAMPEP_0194712266 /NCGR_PEP_ID=MMETSP0296-20130528/4420_1 /TAXON_ID=39354 /ORGANISM="Heterosigma akashiwo, Strain CCMP2393" /LENGTH=159 /DNA_ID=CAMNT_0039610625 /DNA_START=100 /DNA_END=580 /DNA_ORIENTATION=+